ncbi:MAG: penicillin-binding protein 2 [Rhizomicrobium sp.]|jgi:penicillin-binding protein 2
MPLFDRKDKSRYASFTRRTLMLSGGMTGVFALLAGRLYQLQIVNGNQYMTQAEDNRVSQRLIPSPRGRIIDRFGVELATNRRNYRIVLVAEQASNGVEAALDAIGKVIELPPHQKEKVLHDLAQNKKFVPVPVAENLSWEEFARLNLHLPYLPGVQPDVGETRSYPFGAELSHVLGYVAAASPEDKKDDDDPLLDQPGFRVGKRGIEKEYDAQMRGTAGASRVEVNAYGRIIRELNSEAGVPGKDVYLTVDRELQRFVEQRLGDESAACVVMDTASGDVLALTSTPGYDPNLFNVGINNEQWHGLISDDHKPLLNKALGGSYPPGSTFKPAMALAAVDNGLADLQINCTGSIQLGNHVFHCWKKEGHGHVDLHRGIQASCDIFFYEVARRLGIDKMEQAARALGLGAPTGIELPGELGGFIPSRAWKLEKFGIPWQQGETLVSGIGQGYVMTTPLQLCTLIARLASGKALTPRITYEVGPTLQPRLVPAALPFSEAAFTAVRSGLNAVTNEPGGTAYAWRITQAGFEMAGKTGTSQVRRISAEERVTGVKKNESLPWNLRDHALFIAYAPVDRPRYACVVMIEHGAVGAHPQVQMARDILLFAQQRDPVKMPVAYPVHAAEAGPATKGMGT